MHVKLSIIANSAGCGCAFSYMGLVRIGIHSKLRAEKVRKSTVIGVVIKSVRNAVGGRNLLWQSQDQTILLTNREPTTESAMDGVGVGGDENLLEFRFSVYTSEVIFANLEKEIKVYEVLLNDFDTDVEGLAPVTWNATDKTCNGCRYVLSMGPIYTISKTLKLSD